MFGGRALPGPAGAAVKFPQTSLAAIKWVLFLRGGRGKKAKREGQERKAKKEQRRGVGYEREERGSKRKKEGRKGKGSGPLTLSPGSASGR